MRVLVLDSALARRTAAVVDGEQVVAHLTEAGARGHEAALPAMARAAMAEAGGPIDLVAMTVGPGSFTGIRSCLALGHGIALALGVPAVGVTVGEAIADAYPHLGQRELWIATESRRGHLFLERAGVAVSLALADLPAPVGKVAIGGPAANEIAARLAARGADVLLTDARFPRPRHIAAVAVRRAAGTIPPRDPWPLYVDPPAAHPPAGGPRPPPGAGDPRPSPAAGDPRPSPAAGHSRLTPAVGEPRPTPAVGEPRSPPTAGASRAPPTAGESRAPPSAGAAVA